ncbi:MAG: tyrosine-type recombinase/integrase [Pirellulaceae bacterium]
MSKKPPITPIEEVAKMVAQGTLVPAGTPQEIDEERMPPILADHATPRVRTKVDRFYLSVAQIFEMWVQRRTSPHTQRAYRQDVMSLVEHLKLTWPEDAMILLQVSVGEISGWRDSLTKAGAAPKTLNRRVSSVSSFYKYLQGVAAELRLPIVVPNPAHAQFIARASTDPVQPTQALSATRARQLMGLPKGDSVIAYRDRALIRFFLYSGVRIGTACRVKVSDFHHVDEEATVKLNEKGSQRRTIGLHFAAAEAIDAYIKKAEIKSGALFRPRSGPRSHNLANRHMSETAMYLLVQGYLEMLPGSMVAREEDDPLCTEEPNRCIYTPHSLRATTATLLLDAGVDIAKVQELLGHKHVTTTQIYDKRRRTTKESASHDVPI